jgi:hypothetical protein
MKNKKKKNRKQMKNEKNLRKPFASFAAAGRYAFVAQQLTVDGLKGRSACRFPACCASRTNSPPVFPQNRRGDFYLHPILLAL